MREFHSAIKTESAEQTHTQFIERRRLMVGVAAVVSGIVAIPLLAVAQAVSPDGARKINLSGRQRMLIQRMGKFVCLAHLSPEPLSLLSSAKEALELYRRTEVGLRDGDAELGLQAEPNALVLNALSQAGRAFEPYGEIIREAVDERAVDLGQLAAIAELNRPALIAMDRAVGVIERIYENDTLTEQLAMLINIAGRQRMFTQKMILELCVYRSDPTSEIARINLLRTKNRFSVSLNILGRVTPAALSAEKAAPIIAALKEVRSLWETFREEASRFASLPPDSAIEEQLNVDIRAEGLFAGLTPDPSAEALLDLDMRVEELLVRMNEIVLLYEESAG